MDRLRTTRAGLGLDQRQAAILGASAAFHVLVLTVMGITLSSRQNQTAASWDTPILLDLETWPDLGTLGRRPLPQTPGLTGAPAAARLPTRQPTPQTSPRSFDPAGPSTLRRPDTALQPPSAAASAPASGPAGAWPRDVCRDLSNFAAWTAANCGERGPARPAEARGSPPAADARSLEARIGERRGDAAERRREARFDSQKALNDRWLEYYRYRDTPYPGLRSMLTHD